MDAEDGGVPLVDEVVGRVLESALDGGIVLQPWCAAEVPVGEPSLLCLCVLCLKVVNAVVSDESLETFVVIAGESIDAESTKTGSHTAQTLLVNVGQVAGVVYGTLVVVHATAGVVGGNLLQPFLTKTG